MDITDATFLETIGKGQGFQVVDFWAPWSTECRMMERGLKDATEELGIPMYKLLVDTNNIVPTLFAVQSLPTVIVFHNGVEVRRIVGAQPKGKIIEILEPIINKTSK